MPRATTLAKPCARLVDQAVSSRRAGRLGFVWSLEKRTFPLVSVVKNQLFLRAPHSELGVRGKVDGVGVTLLSEAMDRGDCWSSPMLKSWIIRSIGIGAPILIGGKRCPTGALIISP